jgi:nicotinamidase/pyrazinamidase
MSLYNSCLEGIAEESRLAGNVISLFLTVRTATRRKQMASSNVIFWEVDTQADFMLPGGKLYVPGAERLLPTIRRLTDAARQGRVLLVSHGCYHTPDDPEFKTFPPHCIKGTPGSTYVPEALTGKVVTIPNDPAVALPSDLTQYQQIHLEKQTLDIFATCHAGELVKRLGDKEFVVFGVVTEYCVRLAAKGLLERGRRVSIVKDAIETLKAEDGARTVAELQALGAKFITTDEALGLLDGQTYGNRTSKL